MKMLFGYATCKDEKQAEEIAHALVSKRIAACSVAIHSVRSFFSWKGGAQHTGESIVLVKTLEKNKSKVEREIKKMHSYEVPCIIFWKAECSEDYGRWLKKAVK